METIKFISLEALAVTLNLPQKFLRELADKKQIPSLDVNGRLRFNPEVVQSALNQIAAKELAKAEQAYYGRKPKEPRNPTILSGGAE